MIYKNKFPIPDFKNIGINIVTEARTIAGTEAVKFFKESFVKEGFKNNSFNAWNKSNNPFRRGTKTLYNTGILMHSIRKIDGDKYTVIVESDTKYSEIQNDGGYITVTEAMKKHFWKLYYESMDKSKSGKTKGTLTKRAKLCKSIALMPVGKKIKVPQRQFMGNSQSLMNLIDNKLHEYVLQKEHMRK